MRILHVEGGRHLYGGAYQVLHLLRGLAARGHENLLACPAGCALAEAAAPVARVYGLRMRGDLDLPMIVRLRRLIRASRPDLVHLHSRIGADVMGGIAARLSGVPVIHTRRVDNPEPLWLVALKYRLFDRVVAISEGIRDVLLAEGLPAEKLRVVRSAVDYATYARPCAHASIALGVSASTPGTSESRRIVPTLIARGNSSQPLWNPQLPQSAPCSGRSSSARASSSPIRSSIAARAPPTRSPPATPNI